MNKTKIEWTDITWNPTTGCTKISEGCQNCYAEKMARRLKVMGTPKYENGFKLTVHTETLSEPYSWKKPKVVFVNSMSDLFHENMPLSFIQDVFSVMNENPKHIFQVLTKRADILEQYSSLLNWTENIWMGVTVESDRHYDRVDHLRRSGAFIKFLSCEPLLSSLENINLFEIDWVIVGGESGTNARPIKKKWVVEIMNSCDAQRIPFFFKQWGGKNKKKAGSMLDGVEYKNIPISV
jgi:protein gp37